MARQANQPEQPTQAEKGTETKRRYQSGPTPPRMPRDTRSSTRDEQQGVERSASKHDRAEAALSLDLQRASREQLMERARELEIVGFEEMTREELVRRIQEVN